VKPLVIPPEIARELLEGAQRSPAAEVCGALLGTNSVVTDVFWIDNVAPNPAVAYRMDERQFAGVLTASLPEQRLVALFHSHPAGDARPSPLDIRAWSYPELPMVIVSPRDRTLTAWMIADLRVSDVPILPARRASGQDIPFTTAGRMAVIVSAVTAALLLILVSLSLLPPAPPIP